jgi:hypothetical protein
MRLTAYLNMSATDCDHSIPGKAEIQRYERETSDSVRRWAIRPNSHGQPGARESKTRAGMALA